MLEILQVDILVYDFCSIVFHSEDEGLIQYTGIYGLTVALFADINAPILY